MLPAIDENKIVPIPHFPNRMYAAIFRLWETVKAEKIAEGLSLPLETVKKAAEDMGLGAQKNMDVWEKRGYITTIRNAWNLLPYEQLLGVLGWSQEKLEFVLKEEDFLDIKLRGKPVCAPICEEPLDEEGKEKLAAIKRVMDELPGLFDGVPAFDFFSHMEEKPAVKPADGMRAIYSFCGLYTNVLDEDISISFPDALMKAYQRAGVNAVWIPVILYQMVPFAFDESYSAGWEGRQEKLRELIALGKKYGIKVYLYLNEPRSMPLEFFEKYPELQGFTRDRDASLCTSQEAVVDNLKNSVQRLCEDVPGIGGLILITQSENLTHCKSRTPNEGAACPRCAETPHHELIARSVNAIYEGASAADPDIKVIAWVWSWRSACGSWENLYKCIDLLDKNVLIQTKSEEDVPFFAGGQEGVVGDYSLAKPGPSEAAKKYWDYAKARGMKNCAKVQLNTSWECSTVPAMPVFDLIRKRMTGLHELGIDDIMMSWTLGGMPSINLKVANVCLEDPSEEAYDALLKAEYGENAKLVKEAARIFSEAFENFLPRTGVMYNGPQNAGPSTLFYLEDTGLHATMTCYAYDDLKTWCAGFPEDTIEEMFKTISTRWKDGLELIQDMEDCEFKQMAYGGYSLMYSSYLLVKFIRERNAGNMAALPEIVKAERENTVLMYNLMQKNATIGYEAANHYYFNKSMLAEKIINCDDVLRTCLKMIDGRA